MICADCDIKVGQEIARRKARDEAERALLRLRNSNLPLDYRDGKRTIRDLGPRSVDALSVCHLLGLEVSGVYLSGPAGSLKTSVAAAYLAESIRRCGESSSMRPGLYVFVPDLLSGVHASYRSDDAESRDALVHRCVSAPWLVLDDLGKEKASAHAAGVIFEILDGRYRNRRPGQWLIVTSNFDLDALCDRFPNTADEDLADPIRRRLSELTVSVPMVAA